MMDLDYNANLSYDEQSSVIELEYRNYVVEVIMERRWNLMSCRRNYYGTLSFGIIMMVVRFENRVT